MKGISSKLLKSGFSLIEVTLALGVATFCLMAVFGLLPVGLNSSRDASEQTMAAGIATAISADLASSPTISGTTSRFGLLIPAAGSTTSNGFQTVYFSLDGNPTGVVGANAVASGAASRYRATVNMTPASTGTSTPYTKLFSVRILITWPALADSVAASAPVNYAGSFETVTSLNCN